MGISSLPAQQMIRCCCVGCLTIFLFVLSQLRLSAESLPASCPNEIGNTSLPPLTSKQEKFLSFIGGELRSDGNIGIGDITIHRKKREISFPAVINMSMGDLEVAICSEPKGGVGKAHESLLLTYIDPFKIQLALILLGLENGAVSQSKDIPRGDAVAIEVQSFFCPLLYNRRAGIEETVKTCTFQNKTYPRKRIERYIAEDSGKPVADIEWIFVGSNFGANSVCEATIEGMIADLNSDYQSTSSIICPSKEAHAYEKFFIVAPGATPPAGTMVEVFISPKIK